MKHLFPNREGWDSGSEEQIYLPPRLRRLVVGFVAIALTSVLVWLPSGNAPLWLSQLIYGLLKCGRGACHHDLHLYDVMTLSNVDHHLLLLISLPLFIFGILRLLQAILGLPRLRVTNEGIILKTIFRTKWARWDSLSRFEVATGRLSTTTAIAAVCGNGASENLLRKQKFTIPDAFSTGLYEVAVELNERHPQSVDEARVSPPNYKSGQNNVLATCAIACVAIAAGVVVSLLTKQ
jgi:hypothetical protein